MTTPRVASRVAGATRVTVDPTRLYPPDLPDVSLASLTTVALLGIARDRGLSMEGTDADLRARIAADMADEYDVEV